MNSKKITNSNLMLKTIILCSLLILSLTSKCFAIFLDAPEKKDVVEKSSTKEKIPITKTDQRSNKAQDIKPGSDKNEISNVSSAEPELIMCTVDKYGIKFLCDPHWIIQDIDENIFVTISKNPSIILTFAKIDSEIAYSSQISLEFLKQKDLYADGFKMEEIKFAGKNAVKVKAFSKTEPNMRRSDYFLVNNSELYGILFSAYPKEGWEDFKFIIKEIEDSIVFTEIDDQEKGKE